VVPPLSTTEAAGIGSFVSPLFIVPEILTGWAWIPWTNIKHSRNAKNVRISVFMAVNFED
jgi:hypothetical protein